MRTMSFYAGDDDLERIQAEQERVAAMGFRISKSEAIRAMLLRAAQPAPEPALVVQTQPASAAAPVTQTQPDDFEDADKNIYRMLNTETGCDPAPATRPQLFNSQ
jgi:hypothetical protein